MNKRWIFFVQRIMLGSACVLCLAILTGARGGRSGCIGYTYTDGCEPGTTRACYSGLPATRGVGECKDGNQTCGDDQVWGPCTGDVTPAAQDNCDGKDANCDGKIGSSDKQEICNGQDDNCDGQVDEGTDLCPMDQTCMGTAGCQGGMTGPQTVSEGTFQDANYTADGKGRIIKDGDKYSVELGDDFRTDPGPGLEVYLTTETNGDASKGEFINLGSLEMVSGKQTYSIPDGTDLSKYKAISIWCDPFQVVFGFATLSP